MSVAIKIENLSKQYRLGVLGTGTISHDLNRFWAKFRGKEDPFLKIGEANDRTKKGDSDLVWALRNINFEVQTGEILGIIGKNGAGKSTLLKILSKITGPTTGSIKARGRIASLLEVGTGFHPELTGRENIFLNGAILGMTKPEIKSKLDEIVEFAGVVKYIDTPVKRYSSGMMVRLGFAVAAHLEPEILVVDEVLAVGDAEFQKKAIGKMQDVSRTGGRTVLFVSHNMASINVLCRNSVLLDQGQVLKSGPTSDVIPYYLNASKDQDLSCEIYFDEDSTKDFQVISAKITDDQGGVLKNGVVTTSQPYRLNISYLFNKDVNKCHLTVIIKNSSGETVVFFDRSDYYKLYFVAKTGRYETVLNIQNPLLKPGTYSVTIGLSDQYSGLNDHKFDVIHFTVEDLHSIRNSRSGNLFLPMQWEMEKTE